MVQNTSTPHPRFFHCLLVAALFTGTIGLSHTTAQTGATSVVEFVPGTVMVKLQAHGGTERTAGTTQETILRTLTAVLARCGGEQPVPLWKPAYREKLLRISRVKPKLNPRGMAVEQWLNTLAADVMRIYTVRYSAPIDPAALAVEIRSLGGIEYCEPLPRYHPFGARGMFIPNDPLIGGYFEFQNFYAAWDTSKGDSTVVIGILDTGVDYTHPDLAQKIWTNEDETGTDSAGQDRRNNGIDDDANGYIDDWRGWNFQDGDNDPRGIDNNHGTGVASIAAGHTNNGIGIAGAGFNCRYMALKGLALNEGLLYAAANGADVVNCSFGSDFFSRVSNDIIEFVTDLGTLVVCAAGNDNTDMVYYPAGYPSAVSVGSVDYTGTPGRKSGFSTYGYTLDLFATGNNINGCNFGGYFSGGVGTSFAAPIVAGVAGLIKSIHPDWSPRRIAAQLRATAVRIDGINDPSLTDQLGRGRIDAGRAVSAIMPGLTLRDMTLSPGRDSITVTLVNYGEPTNEAHVALTSTTPDMAVETGTLQPGIVQTHQRVSLSYRLSIDPSADFSRRHFLRLTMTDVVNDYEDACTIDITGWTTVAVVESLNLTGIAVHSTDEVWVSTTGPAVLHTTDGGSSWHRLTIPDPALQVQAMAVPCTGTAVVAGISHGNSSPQGILQRSTDGGITWPDQVAIPAVSYCVGLHFFDESDGIVVFASYPSVDSVRIARTTDGGASWSIVPDAILLEGAGAAAYGTLWFVDVNHGWFGGTEGGWIYRTMDGGNTWNRHASGGAYVSGIAFVSPEIGVRISHGSPVIARTTDGGLTWYPNSSSVDVSFLTALTHARGTTQFWTGGGGDRIFTSDLSGSEWRGEYTSRSSYVAQLDAVISDDSVTVWAVTGDNEIMNRKVPMVNAAPFEGPILHPAGNGDGRISLFIVDDRKLTGHTYRITVDDTSGEHTTIDVYDTDADSLALTGIRPADQGRISAIIDGVGMIITDYTEPHVDSDSTLWIIGSTGLDHSVLLPEIDMGDSVIHGIPYPADYEIRISDVIVDTSSSFLGAIPIPTTFSVWNKTEDRQINFIFTEFDNNHVISPFDEVYILEDNEYGEPMLAWEVFFSGTGDDPLPVAGDVWLLRILKPLTYRDVFEFSTRITGVEADMHEETPSLFTLWQNYPNPFNPRTTIRFTLSHNADVEVDIYSILGQRVSALLHDRLGAGHHEFTFDGSHYASGVYIVSVKADGATARRKMLLVK